MATVVVSVPPDPGGPCGPPGPAALEGRPAQQHPWHRQPRRTRVAFGTGRPASTRLALRTRSSAASVRTCRTFRSLRPSGPFAPSGPAGPVMFHESLFAPFAQWNMFRSPDVASLPCVTGSMHAVMMPLWTPGNKVLLASAIAATTPNKTTPATASSFLDGGFIQAPSPFPGRADDPLPGFCLREARQEVAQVRTFHHDQQRSTQLAGNRPPNPSRHSLAILSTGSSHEAALLATTPRVCGARGRRQTRVAPAQRWAGLSPRGRACGCARHLVNPYATSVG